LLSLVDNVPLAAAIVKIAELGIDKVKLELEVTVSTASIEFNSIENAPSS
jgi:hypothetical protein